MKNKRKKLFVYMLVFLLLITASVAVNGSPTSSRQTIRDMGGSILYVGGHGPNNYTTIQDAINDAVNGDIVFVFDDSSPYRENVRINEKSIMLIGENKDTTVIEGISDFWDWTLTFSSATKATVEGFTIRHAETDSIHIGIILEWNCSYITISDIVLTQLISTYSEGIRIQGSHHITIVNTTISKKDQGIIIVQSHDILIEHNALTANGDYHNQYNERQAGIMLESSSAVQIMSNDIQGNSYGVIIKYSMFNSLSSNNLVNNHKKDVFLDAAQSTAWNNNYWGELRFPFKVIIAGRFIDILGRWIPTKINVDFSPAQQPFSI